MNQFKKLTVGDKKKLLYAIIVLIIFILCLAILPHWNRDRNLKKFHKYTFGIVDSIASVSDGGGIAYFYFHINGHKYKGSASNCCRINSGTCNIGDWIIIEYYPIDPKYNNRTGDYYYKPNNSIIIPPNGWDTIPISQIKFLEGL